MIYIDPGQVYIVLVCYSGQTSAYAASILRTLGVNNVYAMKWGMSAWTKKLAETKWTANLSDKYAEVMETAAGTKGAAGAFPKLDTKETIALNILKKRAEAVAEEGFGAASVKIDDIYGLLTENTN